MVDLNGEFKRIWYIVVLVIVLAKSVVNAQGPTEIDEVIFLDKRMNRVSFTDGDGFVKIMCGVKRSTCEKMELVNAEDKPVNDTKCESGVATFILQVSDTPFGEYKCAYNGQQSKAIKLLYHSCGKNDNKTCDDGQFCIVTKGTDGRKQYQCGVDVEKCNAQHKKVGSEQDTRVCPGGPGLVSSMCHAIASSPPVSVQVEQTDECGNDPPAMKYDGIVNQNSVTEIKPKRRNVALSCTDEETALGSNVNCTLTGPDGEPMKFGKVPSSTTCDVGAGFEFPNDVFSRSGIFQMACSLNKGSYWAYMNARFISFADDIKATIDEKATCGISNIPSDFQSECHVIGKDGKKFQDSNVPGEFHCECKIFYLHKAPWKRFEGKTMIKSATIEINSLPSSTAKPVSGQTNGPIAPSATTTTSAKTYSLFGNEMSYGVYVGVIAGVVAGAVIVVTVIVIAVCCCVRKKAEKTPPVQKAEINVEKAPKTEIKVKKDPMEGYTPVAKADNNRQPTEEQAKAVAIRVTGFVVPEFSKDGSQYKTRYWAPWTVANLVTALHEAINRRRDPKAVLNTNGLDEEETQWEKCKLEKTDYETANKGELVKVRVDTNVNGTHGNKMPGFYKDNNIIIAECSLDIGQMHSAVRSLGRGDGENVGVIFLIGRKINRYWVDWKLKFDGPPRDRRFIQQSNPTKKPLGVEVVTATLALSSFKGQQREICIIGVPFERDDPDFPKAMAIGLDQAVHQQADQAGLGFPNIAFMDTKGGFDGAVIAGVCFPALQAYLHFRKMPLLFVINNVRKARYGALSPKLLGSSKAAEQVIAIFKVMHELMMIHGSAEKIAATQSLAVQSIGEQSRKQQSMVEHSRAGQSPRGGAQSMTEQSRNGDQRRTPTSTPRGGRSHEDRGRESRDKGRSPDRGRDRGGRPESRDRGGGGRRR